MKIGTKLSLVFAVAGSLALALPAQAQHHGSSGGGGRPTMGGSAPVSGGPGGGSNVSQGNHGGSFHGGGQGYYGHDGHFHHGHDHVNFFFGGGFGYPFYGYPFYGYPYYGYPGYGYGYAPYYGYGYPAVAPGYTYDPQGIYTGRVVNGGRHRLSLEVQVQQELSEAGFYHGAIDGVVGEGTRRAIRSYERANGLRVDGRIDNQLLETMGLG